MPTGEQFPTNHTVVADDVDDGHEGCAHTRETERVTDPDCGDVQPVTIGAPLVCTLATGHRGWHQDDQHTNWRPSLR
jgi:hypothetical protein